MRSDDHRGSMSNVLVLPSMIGVDINVGVSINAKGGDCCTMLSLMSKGLMSSIFIMMCLYH
jgi:hypothetical protein